MGGVAGEDVPGMVDEVGLMVAGSQPHSVKNDKRVWIQLIGPPLPARGEFQGASLAALQAGWKGLGFPMSLRQRHPNNPPPWTDPDGTKALENWFFTAMD